jgi:argonaute-like protein implicated in RNA metabolism and viral defense
MPEVGEMIVGAYLGSIKGCDLVQYNIKLHRERSKGEIDVVAIDIRQKVAYFCEVATHVITGLQYVKDARPDNVRKLVDKFERDIQYAKAYFKEYAQHFMLWTPVVRKTRSKDAKGDQERDIAEIVEILSERHKVQLEVVSNELYSNCLKELRDYAGSITHDPDSPILRLYQIEDRVRRHLSHLNAQSVSGDA